MTHRIIILMYHIIDIPNSVQEKRYSCLPENFRKQMEFLSNSDYLLVNLDDISEILSGEKKINKDCVAVTFDDGFQDFYINACPILKEFKIPATVYMVAERLNKTNDWMNGSENVERKLLGHDELVELSQHNIKIGSHTSNHLKLNEISNNKVILETELLHSKKELESLLNTPVDHLAYPYGLYDENVVNFAQNVGYKTACTTHSGFNNINSKPLLLRRIEVYFDDNLWQFKNKIKFGENYMPLYFPLKYYIRRLKYLLINY